MNKRLLFCLMIVLTLTACKKEASTDESFAYQVEGTIVSDSVFSLQHLVLFEDTHKGLHRDTIVLDEEDSFTFNGHTSALCELYLCSDGGELCRFYAYPGQKIKLSINCTEGVAYATFDATDSINTWLKQQREVLRSMSITTSKLLLDSLCHKDPTSVRSTLLLRDRINSLNDSIFIRRCLGSLSAEAKPKWLMRSIDNMLDVNGLRNMRSRRLALSSFQLANDTTFLNLNDVRTDYLLMYFWADYSQASIDSLRMLNRLLDTEYPEKRIKMASFCLSAPDSMWWQVQTFAMPGYHTWVKGGMSDARLVPWRVKKVPFVLVCDMFTNVQQADVWGQDLRTALKRVPARTSSIFNSH